MSVVSADHKNLSRLPCYMAYFVAEQPDTPRVVMRHLRGVGPFSQKQWGW
jgi:hypothetical protein